MMKSAVRNSLCAISACCLFTQAQTCLHAQTVIVAPIDEIEILDPQVDSQGKPHVIIVPHGTASNRAEIPPSVLVHKHYYTGDRDFRAQSFPGGPTIVVVSHPYTGEQLHLSVQMLPGSPRVTYRKDFIDYDFGEQRIRIRFHHLLRLKNKYEPTVHFIEGKEFRSRDTDDDEPGHISQWIEKTGIPGGVHKVAAGTKNLVDKTAHGVHKVGEVVTQPVVGVIHATPLNTLFTPENETSMNQRALENSAAAGERLQRELDFPTNR